jgi:glycosyltransferase involved in cell wall biosynthesis
VRVLHVTPSIQRSYGGPTESLIGFIVAAQCVGVDVSVVGPECIDEEAATFAQSVGNARITLIPSFGRDAFIVSPSLLRWVGREARSHDVIHVHGLFNAISSLSARACIRQGLPVVIRPFGTLSQYTFLHRRTMLKRAYFALAERRNVESASAIHFTTSSERVDAERHGINLDNRSYVIPPPAPAVAASPQTDHPATSPPHVLFLGRLAPVKNIESLLDAWPFVVTAIPDARLNIAGSGNESYVHGVRQQVTRLGIAGTVSFNGFADSRAKSKLLASSSLFVLPSHHENFGIAVIEALAASLPVVLSPRVQLAAFVEANRLGLISETTPAALASAIVRGLSDQTLRENVRANAAAAVATNFSPKRIGGLLLQMYEDAQEFRVASATR